jgi:urease accessory protein
MRFRQAAAGFVWLLAPGAALAHSPIKGLDSFYSGILHPLFVPSHLLPVLTLGLLFGQRGSRTVEPAVIAFLAATLLGLTGTLWQFQFPVEPSLLGITALAGVLVALDRPLSSLVWLVLASVLGLLIGLDSAQPDLAGRAQRAALFGTGIAIYLLCLYAMAFAEWFGRRDWQRVGLRVLGSWASASSLLVLALTFAAR